MPAPKNIEINLSETFPHLSKAPIIESVIELRARAEMPLEEDSQLKRLETLLPDYPSKQAHRQVQHELKFAPTSQAEHTVQDFGWNGHICRSADNLQMAQFNRDGFRFSRLRPYESWEKFSTEALRLWRIYVELARPSEIQRLGVRFINQLMVPVDGFDLDEYLTASPRGPRGLPMPLTGFLHTQTFLVSGKPFGMQIIQTVLQPQTMESKEAGLVLDIDTFTLQPFLQGTDIIESHLGQMRWLKNKAFFGSFTEKAIERLK